MRRGGLPGAAAVLAAHGLAPDSGGYTVEAMQALAAARGWRVETEATAGPDGLGRARAAVWRPARRAERAGATVVRRAAASEAEALVLALAATLERAER